MHVRVVAKVDIVGTEEAIAVHGAGLRFQGDVAVDAAAGLPQVRTSTPRARPGCGLLKDVGVESSDWGDSVIQVSAKDKLVSEKVPVLDAGGASPLVSLKELVALNDSQAAHRALLEFQAVGKLAFFST